MDINKKEGFVSYVLVLDVNDNGILYYYRGYYNSGDRPIPANTNLFMEAMKIPFKYEAETICYFLNENNQLFKYHVEEHAYM